MNYEFITIIATILLVGVSIAGFILQALKSMSRTTDARFVKIDERFRQIDQWFDRIDERFEKVDARFEKIDRRLDKFDERFYEIQKEFTTIQREFTTVHSGIARLEGLIEGIRVSFPAAPVPELGRQG